MIYLQSFQKTDIKGLFLILLVMTFCSGCASSFSTIRTNNPALSSRYYIASYDKVINAAVEASSKTRNWKVEDVDEAQGIITVMDADIWRRYIIKIFVQQIPNGQIKVDVSSRTSADIIAANEEFIAEFLEKLDNLLK